MLESWSRYETRITPAYAGKRARFQVRFQHQQDHPRLCGEKFCKAKKIMQRVGSPPPMRGKASDTRRPVCKAGITPAYAGKRSAVVLCGMKKKDHPRLCGEKCIRPCASPMTRGSPPPMRGKAVDLMIGLRSVGITPAYAGKSKRRKWLCR